MPVAGNSSRETSPGPSNRLGAEPRQDPVSRIYEVLRIDDGGDAQVRILVRRAILQVARFVVHFAEALKREAASQEVAADSPPPRRRPGLQERLHTEPGAVESRKD